MRASPARRPDDAAPPLPRPPSAAPQAPAAAETLVLHTRLLGDLRVSGTAEQAADVLRVLLRRSKTDQHVAG